MLVCVNSHVIMGKNVINHVLLIHSTIAMYPTLEKFSGHIALAYSLPIVVNRISHKSKYIQP